MQTELTLTDLAIFEKPTIMYLAGHPSEYLSIGFGKDIKLSKTQTIQLCMYYFLNPDSNNFILNIPIKSLAKSINCSIETVRKNNRFFSDKLFISFTENKNHTLSVKLHIKDDFNSENCLSLHKNLLFKINKLSNVNSVRITFFFILRLYENNKLYNKGTIFYSNNDIKRFLPSNINRPKIINQLVMELLDIFDIDNTAQGFLISYK